MLIMLNVLTMLVLPINLTIQIKLFSIFPEFPACPSLRATVSALQAPFSSLHIAHTNAFLLCILVLESISVPDTIFLLFFTWFHKLQQQASIFQPTRNNPNSSTYFLPPPHSQDRPVFWQRGHSGPRLWPRRGQARPASSVFSPELELWTQLLSPAALQQFSSWLLNYLAPHWPAQFLAFADAVEQFLRILWIRLFAVSPETPITLPGLWAYLISLKRKEDQMRAEQFSLGDLGKKEGVDTVTQNRRTIGSYWYR